MRQVIEHTGVPARPLLQSGWLRRLLDRVLKPLDGDRLIRPDTLSRHTLRDIGLADDPRANRLLGDGWLRR